MKAVFVLGVLSAVVLSVCASSISQAPGNSDDDASFPDATLVVPEAHGNRMKRSPLDPIVAPLIVAKSFLYGALVGPKLFRTHYYHAKPHYYHYNHGGHHGGWGGWGWGK